MAVTVGAGARAAQVQAAGGQHDTSDELRTPRLLLPVAVRLMGEDEAALDESAKKQGS